MTQVRHFVNMVAMSNLTVGTRKPTWTLGWRLRRSLEEADISVETMARTLQVSRQTVSRWLHDDGPVKAVHLVIWAEVCDVDYFWLVDQDPPPDGGSLIDLINRTVENQDDPTENCIDLRDREPAAA